MATAVVSHRFVFGIKGGVTSNVNFLDEQTVIYPAGSNCILYHIDQKSQRFILGSDKSQGMTAIAISPNRRYIAIAERGDKPTITIYDLHTLKRRKILSSADHNFGEYVSLAFSPDSKYLASQGGKPDWTLLYWTWEKSKVMATTKTTNQQSAPIYQVTFNPQDNTQLCVIGNGIFKLFRYSEGNLKQFAFLKMEPHNYLCQSWVTEDKVIVGTDEGRLFLFEAGELKNEFTLTTSASDFKSRIILINHSCYLKNIYSIYIRIYISWPTIDQITDAKHEDKTPINDIVTYEKGFICCTASGAAYIFEKGEERDSYKKLKEIRLPIDTQHADTPDSSIPEIKHLALSPSEENLICSTSDNQLYTVVVSTADISKGDIPRFDVLTFPFHRDAITGMDTCIRKPLIATCSMDKSVRIWNFESGMLELHKDFQEEAFSVAVHPSGLYILVGFSDKLRLMNLLIDDIRTFREFTIRGCRECSFSNGGHLFAAVHGNVIQVYSTTTFDNVTNLKGHNGKVRSVRWSIDDGSIISCGMDGAVYEWSVFTSKREGESVLKSCSYTDVTVSPEGKVIYAVGTDHTLKEICDSQILRDIHAGDAVFTQVAISHSGKMLFAGTNNGTVRSIKYPLTATGEWQEYQAHALGVAKLRISYDDQYLFSVSEDGSFYIFKISEKEGRGLKRDKEVAFAEEILITKSDLEEKNAMMTELKTRVDELKMENEYQLRLKDMNYNEKIRELTEKFIQEMESLKTKNQVLKTEKDKEETRHEEQIHDVLEDHAKELQDLESANNQKLMSEYEKYQELQAKSQKMQEEYERQLNEMDESKEVSLQDLTEYYENKLQEKSSQLEQANEEQQQLTREYDETKRQIEEDVDREIVDIKNKYERRLRDEKEANLRLKGETGIMRKKVNY
ncbi:uncharacterized protein TRIADDRAFT_27651 [Trichoplax adhaerens]|uniref:EML-like second beta-propeller domain-containing protein n=1 Tax=Trichoplax adhaerens TaxID=10228 RepID=B3S1R1_TRIAD|nr:hypothetical protein TRIADDRAFT_27651 [Trichoplax adhaerens]EDV23339.1 hypothetical protein TRIADDRAFT_27651 [Trichoplax adhaerens]|eukprot:XP_002114249.1 hypothetical protein TRIADDRAFT_27651 [Trichoplax adhaerens]